MKPWWKNSIELEAAGAIVLIVLVCFVVGYFENRSAKKVLPSVEKTNTVGVLKTQENTK